MSIHNLPLEIMQHILTTLCCEPVIISIPNHTYCTPRRDVTKQEIISLVCSKWRAIALRTSELWNSVMVVFWTSRNFNLDHGLENVQAWLNRAGTSSISLMILVQLDCGILKEPDVRKTKQSLLPYQIQHLGLHFTGALFIPSGTACHLKTLCVEYHKGSENRVEFPPLPSLPSLKVLRLVLDLDDFTDYRNLYTIPWHQLSAFDNGSTAYWPSQICLHILRQCQYLIKCTLWMSSAQESEAEDDIILPNLKILNLKFHWRGSADHVLRPLILPNIKSLHFKSDSSQIALDPTVIELMARRSGFKNLAFFTVANMSNPVRVGSLLRYMPALRSIELGHVIVDKRTWHDLSLGIIGPHLEEIQFEGLKGVDIGLLLKAIRERYVYAMAPGSSQIKPFKSVVAGCYWDKDTIDTLLREADLCSEESKARITLLDSPLSWAIE